MEERDVIIGQSSTGQGLQLGDGENSPASSNNGQSLQGHKLPPGGAKECIPASGISKLTPEINKRVSDEKLDVADVVQNKDLLPTMAKKHHPFPIMKTRIFNTIHKKTNLNNLETSQQMRPQNNTFRDSSDPFSPRPEHSTLISTPQNRFLCVPAPVPPTQGKSRGKRKSTPQKFLRSILVKREKSRERQRKRRASWSPGRLQREREKNAARGRATRAAMTTEQKEMYRAAKRENAKISAESRELSRTRQKRHRENWSPTRVNKERAKNAARRRAARASMTPEQRATVRASNAEQQRRIRAMMSPERRQAIRETNAARLRKFRASMTTEQKQAMRNRDTHAARNRRQQGEKSTKHSQAITMAAAAQERAVADVLASLESLISKAPS